MEHHNGERPQSARININYESKKPKVSFSYPVSLKKSRTVGSMFSWILFFWIIANIPIYIYWSVQFNTLDWYEPNTIEKYSLCVAEHPIETLTDYSTIRNEVCYFSEGWATLSRGLIFMIIIFLYGLFVPYLIYRPWKKKWDKLYPSFQAFMSRKKYKTFKKEDVRFDKEYFVELPVFNNVVCDFKATKDFGSMLKSFEIKEYEYTYNTRKGKRKNESIWYARWYFKSKPKEGKLEVIFK